MTTIGPTYARTVEPIPVRSGTRSLWPLLPKRTVPRLAQGRLHIFDWWHLVSQRSTRQPFDTSGPRGFPTVRSRRSFFAASRLISRTASDAICLCWSRSQNCTTPSIFPKSLGTQLHRIVRCCLNHEVRNDSGRDTSESKAQMSVAARHVDGAMARDSFDNRQRVGRRRTLTTMHLEPGTSLKRRKKLTHAVYSR